MPERAHSLQDQSLGYLQSAWMLGPSQCGPNVLIWRPASDPRNLFAGAGKDILCVGGGSRGVGRAQAVGHEDEDGDGDEAAEETGSQATAVSAASQRVVQLPVWLPALPAACPAMCLACLAVWGAACHVKCNSAILWSMPIPPRHAPRSNTPPNR